MGMNTALMLINDQIDEIHKSDDLNKRIYGAVLGSERDSQYLDLIGIKIIGTDHNSCYLPIMVGDNNGVIIKDCAISADHSQNPEIDLLKNLANKHGFYLRKKGKK